MLSVAINSSSYPVRQLTLVSPIHRVFPHNLYPHSLDQRLICVFYSTRHDYHMKVISIFNILTRTCFKREVLKLKFYHF